MQSAWMREHATGSQRLQNARAWRAKRVSRRGRRVNARSSDVSWMRYDRRGEHVHKYRSILV
jgi:hypothetical protein